MNKEKFNQTLKKHKQLMQEFIETKKDTLISPIKNTGEELTLLAANFKCHKCHYNDRLQFHHLIMRPDAKYINDHVRYITARHYWGNVIILCEKCHNEYHQVGIIERDEKAFISKEKIKKIKEMYQ